MTSPPARELRWYQTEAVDAVYSVWAADPLARPGVVLPTGTGKEQPVTTPIPTPYGVRPLGDIQVGDEVFTGSGRSTVVVATHPQGVKRVFSVRFSDDTSALCGKKHLWMVSDAGPVGSLNQRRVRKNFLADTYTVRDMVAAGRRLVIPRHGVARYRGRPLTDPVALAEEVYGAVLNDPSRLSVFPPGVFVAPEDDRRALLDTVGTVQGSTAEPTQIPEWVRTAGAAVGSAPVRVEQYCVYIPAGAGLFAEQLFRLVWSLGGTARWLATGEVKGKKSRTPPDTVDRVIVMEYPGRRVSPEALTARADRIVTGVVSGDRVECMCITVAHPSGTYLTGHEHIVTHNSTVIAKIAADARRQGQRVVMLAHRGELLHQMADAVKAVDPAGPRPGIVAGPADDPTGDIVSASFQTLAGPDRLAAIGRRDVVLADEAHHISADTYLQVLHRLGALPPGPANIDFPGFKAPGVPAESPLEAVTWARTAGFTATMSRADERSLGDVWSHIAYEKSISWAIDNGFLVHPRGKVVRIEGLNKLASVKNGYGGAGGPDYRAGDLSDVMAASVDSTVDAVLRHVGPGTGRASIIFAVSVDHAEVISAKLNAFGHRTAAVTGRMSLAARTPIYADFHAGNLDSLVTVAVLSEGADFPRCDSVVMARPTRSQNLYVQMLGRALRLYPGKTDALVLDLTGTSRDMSMISVTDVYPQTPVEVIDTNGMPIDPATEPEPLPGVGRKPPKPERMGIIDVEDIELLADRRVNWLRTSTGVRFMDVHTGLLFLWPATAAPDEPCYVGYASKKGSRGWSWFTGSDGAPATMTTAEAVVVAEDFAQKTAKGLPSNGAHRRRNEPPTDGQIGYAARLGIPDVDNKTKSRLSDDISVAVAEGILPPSPARSPAVSR